MEKGREGRKEEIGRRVGGVSHGESRTQRGVVNELSSVYSLYLSCLSVCLYVSRCVYISACDVLRHRFPLRICPCVCVSVPSYVFGWFCSLVVHLYHSAYRSVALYLALSLLPRLSLVV